MKRREIAETKAGVAEQLRMVEDEVWENYERMRMEFEDDRGQNERRAIQILDEKLDEKEQECYILLAEKEREVSRLLQGLPLMSNKIDKLTEKLK